MGKSPTTPANGFASLSTNYAHYAWFRSFQRPWYRHYSPHPRPAAAAAAEARVAVAGAATAVIHDADAAAGCEAALALRHL